MAIINLFIFAGFKNWKDGTVAFKDHQASAAVYMCISQNTHQQFSSNNIIAHAPYSI